PHGVRRLDEHDREDAGEVQDDARDHEQRRGGLLDPPDGARDEVDREAERERGRHAADGASHEASQLSTTTVPPSPERISDRPATAAMRATIEARMPRRSSPIASGSNPGPASTT